MIDKDELITGVEVGRCLGTNDHDLIAFNIPKQRIAPKNTVDVMLQNGYFLKFKGSLNYINWKRNILKKLGLLTSYSDICSSGANF